MHEYFLCTVVPAERVDGALKILQGYCGHQPRHRYRRALTFQKHPKLPKTGISLPQGQRPPPKLALYKELTEILKKQSYSLQIIYDIDFEDFKSSPSAEAKTVDLNERPGTLVWRDIPDPPTSKQYNSRRVVNIKDEDKLPTILTSNNHQYRNEQIQEYWRAVRDDVEFFLFRILDYPSNPPADPKTGQLPIRDSLPAFQELITFDAENKWVLFASVYVSDATDPRQVKQAVDALLTVKAQLSLELDLQLVDRRPLDTRLPQF